MDNYKVKVNNEVESEEVQELLESLGLEFVDIEEYEYPQWLAVTQKGGTFSNYMGCKSRWYTCSPKELTIPQLRDLVVLKRNDVADATHVNTRTNTPFLVQGSKEYFYLNNKWIISDSVNDLKPIEEKEMKEFLVNHDGKWTLQLLDADTEENNYRVAVPSGAEIAASYKNGNIYFWKDNGLTNWVKKELDFLGRDNGWYECNSSKLTTLGEFINEWVGDVEIIWQRSETESLNDTYAKIEQARQETVKVAIDELKHRVYKKDVSHLDFIDVYRVLELFNVQSHAVGHAVKKLLCSGGRGAKDEAQDIQEAIDSLIRYQEMKNEDE